MRKKLLIISGPTATGKTGLSLEIAQRYLNDEWAIVNFDSLLFYQDINIGTAKPNSEELLAVEHHLINVNPITKEINASDFVQLALNKINELHINGIIPILVGGSTFYLRSLIKGMYESTPTSPEVRSHVEALYKEEGIFPFLQYLKEFDPKSFQELHENDHYRIQRAYEHHKMTGAPISKEKERSDDNDPYDFSKNIRPDWDILHISLDMPKEQHWEIIESRTHEMINNGLVQEVKEILQNGHSGEEKPLQSIGYKETISYLNSQEIQTMDQLTERIYFATRQLAKSQRTFLKKVSPKIMINPFEDKKDLFAKIKDWLEK